MSSRSHPSRPSARGQRLALLAAIALILALAVPPTAVDAAPSGPLSLVSHTSTGDPGDDDSSLPAISRDGRYVVFQSSATDLVEGVSDTNNGSDIFLWDRTTQAVTLVSHSAADPMQTGSTSAVNPVISADGSTIAYNSFATDLAAGIVDGNNASDIVVYDRAAGTATYASLQAGTNVTCDSIVGSYEPTLSDNGAWLAYHSDCTDITTTQAEGGVHDRDVFLHHTAGGGNVLVSTANGSQAAANNISGQPTVSGDGAYVVFTTLATDVGSNVAPANDTNGADDVVRYTRSTGVNHVLSQQSGVTGDGTSDNPAVSRDGQLVAYTTEATDLDGMPDTNGQVDVALWRSDGLTTSYISRIASGTNTGDGPSFRPEMAADGSTVAFLSYATDIADVGIKTTDTYSDVFAYTTADDTVTLLSANIDGDDGGDGDSGSPNFAVGLSVADDGRTVAFTSAATDLTTINDANAADDIHVAQPGLPTMMASLPDAGISDGDSLQPVLSGDGQAVAFASDATNLVTGDANGSRDVYVQGGQGQDALAIAPAAILEGDQGTTQLQLTVSLGQARPSAVTVDYATGDGSATAPEDYTATSGTLTLPAGETSATITVDIVGDTQPEPDETFTVTLTDPSSGVTLGSAEATATILDDDARASVLDGVNDTIYLRTDRTIDVALQISRETFTAAPTPPARPTGALLATDAAFADALASGALQVDPGQPAGAATVDGRPLLLTPTDQLDPAVVQELERLDVTEVTILGGTAAIDATVEADLQARGYTTTRYAGPSRLETATDIAARAFPDAERAILSRAFAAPGGPETQAFADSLAAGAWAAAEGWPLLFTQTEVLSSSTRTYLEGSGIHTIYVVGGTAAVSDAVVAELTGMAIDVVRVEGPTRFETALAVAQRRGYASESDAGRVMLLDGTADAAWAAGFAGAGHSAIHGAPVVLAAADQIPPSTGAWLDGTVSQSSLLVDEGDVTGPVLVCAIAEPRCLEGRSMLGLPDLAQVVFEVGATVAAGSTVSGTITTVEEGALVTVSGPCVGPPSASMVPAGTSPLEVQVPVDSPRGPCTITLEVVFTNGSRQEVRLAIDISD